MYNKKSQGHSLVFLVILGNLFSYAKLTTTIVLAMKIMLFAYLTGFLVTIVLAPDSIYILKSIKISKLLPYPIDHLSGLMRTDCQC